MSKLYNVPVTIRGGETSIRPNPDNHDDLSSLVSSSLLRVGKNGNKWYGCSFTFDSEQAEELATYNVAKIVLKCQVKNTFQRDNTLTTYGPKANDDLTSFTIEEPIKASIYNQYAPFNALIYAVSGAQEILAAGGVVFCGAAPSVNSYVDVVSATLEVYTNETLKRVSFNPVSGEYSGSDIEFWTDGTYKTVTIPAGAPTRAHHSFLGWNTKADGSGTMVQPGGTISVNNDTTLYAQWFSLHSRLSSAIADSVEIGDSLAVSWTNYTEEYTNVLRIVCKSYSEEYADFEFATSSMDYSVVSYSYQLPDDYYYRLPTTVSGEATIFLDTYSGNELVGTDSKSFSPLVPESILPRPFAYYIFPQNDNQAIASWNIAVKSYSRFRFNVAFSYSETYTSIGSKVAYFTIIGPNVNVRVENPALENNVLSSVLETDGTLSFELTAVDLRGRSYSVSRSFPVYNYNNPSISSFVAFRCNSSGIEDYVTGDTASVTATYDWTQIGQNALTAKIYYKEHDAVVWNEVVSNAASGTTYLIRQGLIDVSKAYLVKIDLRDSVGNSAVYEVSITTVSGIAFGLKNDRARFGGPVLKPGLQIDWDTDIKGDLNLAGNATGLVKSVNGADGVVIITPGGIGAAELDTDDKVLANQASSAIVSFQDTFVISGSNAGRLLLVYVINDANITVPANETEAIEIGTEIEVAQMGAGVLTFVGETGVTFRSLDSAVSTAGQYAVASLKKIGVNEWLIAGALA